MQIGQATDSIKLVVSTVAEAEYLLEYLLQSGEDGWTVDVSAPFAYACSPYPSQS